MCWPLWPVCGRPLPQPQTTSATSLSRIPDSLMSFWVSSCSSPHLSRSSSLENQRAMPTSELAFSSPNHFRDKVNINHVELGLGTVFHDSVKNDCLPGSFHFKAGLLLDFSLDPRDEGLACFQPSTGAYPFSKPEASPLGFNMLDQKYSSVLVEHHCPYSDYNLLFKVSLDPPRSAPYQRGLCSESI